MAGITIETLKQAVGGPADVKAQMKAVLMASRTRRAYRVAGSQLILPADFDVTLEGPETVVDFGSGGQPADTYWKLEVSTISSSRTEIVYKLNFAFPGSAVYDLDQLVEVDPDNYAPVDNPQGFDERITAAIALMVPQAVEDAMSPVLDVINTGRLSDSALTTKIAAVSATEMGNAESALRDETVGVVQSVLGGGTAGLVRVESGTLTDLNTPRPLWGGVIIWLVSHQDDSPVNFADGDIVTLVAFSPLSVPGLAAWFDSIVLDEALDNGGSVTTWPNLAPGKPAAVAGATHPTFVTGVVNSHPAVQFNGVDGLLTCTLPVGYTGPSAVYLVARSLPATTTGTDFFFDGASTLTPQLQLALARNATNNWAVYNGDSFTKAGATNAVHLFRIDFENPLSELFVDGVSLGTGTTDDNRTITKLTLGGRADGATANILDGYICALVYIQGTVSAADDLALSAYLKTRYGL